VEGSIRGCGGRVGGGAPSGEIAGSSGDVSMLRVRPSAERGPRAPKRDLVTYQRDLIPHKKDLVTQKRHKKDLHKRDLPNNANIPEQLSDEAALAPTPASSSKLLPSKGPATAQESPDAAQKSSNTLVPSTAPLCTLSASDLLHHSRPHTSPAVGAAFLGQPPPSLFLSCPPPSPPPGSRPLTATRKGGEMYTKNKNDIYKQ
jgi:hypothetical protein